MSIPIILINRDRLSTTEKLIDQLLVLGYDDLYILDMGSTYEPLLNYYDTCRDFTMIPHTNGSHKVLWEQGILRELFSQHPFVAISDSDIELNQYTPKGFIEDMIVVAKDFRVDKVGLAIEYKDITNDFLKKIIEPIESMYWLNRLPHITHQVYAAPTDTSFCVVRPSMAFTYRAVRIGGSYTCRHIPWYTDFSNLTPEEEYFITHADPAVSTYSGHYNNWKKQHG